ncbi:unnamed protein product [Ceutorhynchus assimilis]|uniref:Uncharacterized protein n=1 Tax=Ceutorhynchus assimilis TaxID=467358 RepID=A0A9N9QMB3_9CUCU|nr:unnamed protein product [Ceutorhynchus assimilis]
MPTWQRCRSCSTWESMKEKHKSVSFQDFFFKPFEFVSFNGCEAENITYFQFHMQFKEIQTYKLLRHFIVQRRLGVRVDRRTHHREVEKLYHLLGPHSHLTHLFPVKKPKNPTPDPEGSPTPVPPESKLSTAVPEAFPSVPVEVPATPVAGPRAGPSTDTRVEGSPEGQVNVFGDSDSEESEINVPVRFTKRALISPSPSPFLAGPALEGSDETETQENVQVLSEPSKAGPVRKKRRTALQLLWERQRSWERDGWMKKLILKDMLPGAAPTRQTQRKISRAGCKITDVTQEEIEKRLLVSK